MDRSTTTRSSAERRPGTRRRDQAAARREQLLAVALDQFAEKGVHGTTIREIAQAAGITEGLIYHYFPSKTALIQAVVERYSLVHEVIGLVQEMRGVPVREALYQLCLRFLEMLRHKRKFMNMVFTDALRDPELEQAFQQITQRGFDLVLQFMNERVATGELRPHDTVISLRLLHGSVMWYCFSEERCALPLPSPDPEAFARGVVDTVLDGIAGSGRGEECTSDIL
jgi:AcrR family transcriptional regulator